MPQMSPMNWLILLVLFSAVFTTVLVKMNFLYKKKFFLQESLTSNKMNFKQSI